MILGGRGQRGGAFRFAVSGWAQGSCTPTISRTPNLPADSSLSPWPCNSEWLQHWERGAQSVFGGNWDQYSRGTPEMGSLKTLS